MKVKAYRPLAQTQDYKPKRKIPWQGIACALGPFIAANAIWFFIYRSVAVTGNTKVAGMGKNPVAPRQEEERRHRDVSDEARAMARNMAPGMAEEMAGRLAKKKVMEYLEEDWLGTFQIKDYQAVKVYHRQAAVKTKDKYLGFSKGTKCVVHNYQLLDKNDGRGLASLQVGKDVYFFSFQWIGQASPVPEDLKEIEIVQGKKIQILRSK